MSRYVILILLTAPLIMFAVANLIVAYKLKRMSRKRLIIGLAFWAIIFIGLISMEPAYSFLFSNKLTNTEPLSLFDVIQITGIIFTLLVANKAYSKVDALEHRVQELHRQLSIILSEEKE